jgi:hypothetical protein
MFGIKGAMIPTKQSPSRILEIIWLGDRVAGGVLDYCLGMPEPCTHCACREGE